MLIATFYDANEGLHAVPCISERECYSTFVTFLLKQMALASFDQYWSETDGCVGEMLSDPQKQLARLIADSDGIESDGGWDFKYKIITTEPQEGLKLIPAENQCGGSTQGVAGNSQVGGNSTSSNQSNTGANMASPSYAVPVRLTGIITYPGSRVSDLLIGGERIQIPNRALRLAMEG